jgi:excisionase family DNA binding protein
MTQEQVLLKIDEAATRLGVGRSFLYAAIQRGELGTVKLGRARRVPTSEIAAYIQRLREEQTLNGG